MPEPVARPCATVRELIPELAAGVASGDARAAALTHLAGCAGCRARLEDTTRLVDELVLLAPEHEPPAGFEARVLGALPGRRVPLYRRASTWLAAAALVVTGAGAATVTRALDTDAPTPAASGLHAAGLTTGSGSAVGQVFAFAGRPSWVFMTVSGAPSGDYVVSLVTRDGRSREIGECWVDEGRAAWGTTMTVPVGAVDRVEMRGEDGATLTAAFSR
jgi:hypothetical protein